MPTPSDRAPQPGERFRYSRVRTIPTLEYVVDPDGVARWTGHTVRLPELYAETPTGNLAELIETLTQETLG